MKLQLTREHSGVSDEIVDYFYEGKVYQDFETPDRMDQKGVQFVKELTIGDGEYNLLGDLELLKELNEFLANLLQELK